MTMGERLKGEREMAEIYLLLVVDDITVREDKEDVLWLQVRVGQTVVMEN